MSAANRRFAFMQNRALADPAAIEAVAGDTLRSWFNTYDGMEGGGPLVTMA